MRRVSISSGFSKLWCVCFFLRSFAICLFVCLFFFVRFEKCRTRKKGRKEERHHHHPTTRSSTTHKKAAFFGEERYSSSSVALARSRLNARDVRTTGDCSWWGAGLPWDTPSNSRRYDPVFSSLFVVAVLCRNDASSIDRSIDRCRLALLDTARGVTTQSRAARRTETRGRRSRRSHALK